MTLNEYGALVTAALDASSGGTAEYSESFNIDIEACFRLRLTPAQAAEKLLAKYCGPAEPDEPTLAELTRYAGHPDDDRETIAPGDEHYYRPPGAVDR